MKPNRKTARGREEYICTTLGMNCHKFSPGFWPPILILLLTGRWEREIQKCRITFTTSFSSLLLFATFLRNLACNSYFIPAALYFKLTRGQFSSIFSPKLFLATNLSPANLGRKLNFKLDRGRWWSCISIYTPFSFS